MLAVVVLLASIRLGDIQGLADKLSFALTLASLLLAVLAIGYNVVTNTSFSRTISTLDDASRDIARISNSVSEAAKDLSTKIEVIPSKLESMEGKVSEMTLLMKQIPEKQTEIPLDKNKSNAIDQVADYFIKQEHAGAFVVLYICSLSLTRKKIFNPADFNSSSGFKFLNPSYILGSIALIYSIGFVVFEIVNQALDVYMLPDKLEVITRPLIEGIINSISIVGETKESLISDLAYIDKYFSN